MPMARGAILPSRPLEQREGTSILLLATDVFNQLISTSANAYSSKPSRHWRYTRPPTLPWNGWSTTMNTSRGSANWPPPKR